MDAVASYVRDCATQSTQPAHMYIETAGGKIHARHIFRSLVLRQAISSYVWLGVHSPTLSGSTQLESYRPLFLPTILIGDSKLGGISATISSYESLQLRGYIVDAVLLFRDDYYRNWEYLEPYFADRGLTVYPILFPPPKHADAKHNFELTERYYRELVPESQRGGIFDVLSHLDNCHSKRLEELDSMYQRTVDSIWWPFVQHGLVKTKKDVTIIDSAWGDAFSIYNSNDSRTASDKPHSLLAPQFDSSASWWTQALGHAHPALTLAAARAAGRYGHVMFPQGSHLPALQLAERLVFKGPGKGWASRAFFSDDGSTGMEVALKMALRSFAVQQDGGLDSGKERQKRRDLGILGLNGSYHGDTIGVMDACEEGIYTCEWHEAKGYWLDPPTLSIQKGKMIISLPPAIAAEDENGTHVVEGHSIHEVYDVGKRMETSLAGIYRRYLERTLARLLKSGDRTIATLILEPVSRYVKICIYDY